MSTIKVFSLGGLDKKSNDLTRDPAKASRMLNMEFDTQSQIKKRGGYAKCGIDAGYTLPDVSPFTYTIKDVIYCSAKDEFLVFAEYDVFLDIYILKRNGVNFTTKYLAGFGIGEASYPISYTENTFSIYFSLLNGVWKYDGSILYRSGLLVPYRTISSKKIVNSGASGVFNGVSSTSGYYIRVIPKFTDNNGVYTYGPYIESDVQWNNGATITLTNFFYLNTYSKYLIITQAALTTLDSTSRTVTFTAGNNNYVAGDKLLVLAGDSPYFAITLPLNRTSVELEVESVIGTTVTFTAASLADVSITIQAGHNIYFDRKCEYIIAISQTKDTGYYVSLSFLADDNNKFISNLKNATETFTLNDGGFSTGLLIPLEDIYDSTTLKLRPPICKYLTSYGDQIVYGSVSSTYDHNNQVVPYTNNDMIIYSDVSEGDGPENISELNRQKIGETWDGEITGLKRANDSLIVFKSRGVFALDGTLIPGQYSLRKLNTNFEGCTTHASILQADEGVYYQGHNGVFFTNGVQVEKLTYELDSLYKSGSYLNTRSARLKKKQKSIFYTPDMIDPSEGNVTVIDYYYNQVYMWSNVNATAGLVEDKNGDVYFCDDTSIYLFNELYVDDSTCVGGIDGAFYSTTWHHAGEPALGKKWLSIRQFALTVDAFTSRIITEGDWNPATLVSPLTSPQLTNDTLSFDSLEQTKFLMLNMQTKRSMRFTFKNDTINENLAITGYELTYEVFNAVDKN